MDSEVLSLLDMVITRDDARRVLFERRQKARGRASAKRSLGHKCGLL